MGLHICYELRLPSETPDDDALNLIERLRAYSVTLGFDDTSPIAKLTGGDLERGDECLERWSVPWWMHVASQGIRRGRDGTASEVGNPDRLAVAGFFMYPGARSEAAAFGLVRPFIDQPPMDAERDDDEWQNWFWHYCCKTQYASVVSDEHFLHCHLSVVRMLEEAERIGFGITVRDETHYWDTRSTEQTLLEVRNMNRIVARFAGALHDAMSSSEHRVEGAIFENPDFERLETESLEHRRDDDPA